jgi:SAM-dependent methyltransferase
MLGEEWAVAANGGLADVLGSGWSSVEDWGVWGLGDRHEIDVQLPVPLIGHVVIDADVHVVLRDPIRSQFVDVFAGESKLALWHFNHEMNRGIRTVRIPARVARTSVTGIPWVTLTFKPHCVVKPTDLDPTTLDRRMLGLGLHRIRMRLSNTSHIDVVTHFEVAGWAVRDDENLGDTVCISVDEEEVARIPARLYNPELEKTIGIGKCAFRFYFYQTPGVFSPTRVEVRSASSGELLANGRHELQPLLSDRDLQQTLGERFCSAVPVGVTAAQNRVNIRVKVLAPTTFVLGILPLDSAQPTPADVDVKHISSTGHLAISELGFTLARDDRSDLKVAAMRVCDRNADQTEPWGERLEDFASSMCIPFSLDWLTLPAEENITRVAGKTDKTSFAVGGVSAAHKIHLIAKRLLGGGIGRVLDWGIGCGRVAVPLKRAFLNDAEILGVDIDRDNVDWCERHLTDVKVQMGDYYPPLNFESGSIDLIYGISVMTHLSRDAQAVWLRELRRILRQGGICILTTHGEYAISLVDWFPSAVYRDIMKLGISDVMLDDNLGPHLAIPGYYRGTFQLRRQVEEHWSKYLKIVGYLPAGSHAHQDIIVMMKN